MATSPGSARALPPPPAVYTGASIAANVYGLAVDPPASMKAVDLFEAHAGRALSILQWSLPWFSGQAYNRFDGTLMEAVRQHGSLTLLDWDSASAAVLPAFDQPRFALSTIIDGSHDTYIRQFAADTKAWGHPFFLRFDQGMNNDGLAWSEGKNGNSGGQFVQAWRHVHDIFVQEGATNVTWVWCPGVEIAGALALDGLYPGDAYVDWTCTTGYNLGTNANGDGNWISFNDLFGSTYNRLLSLAPDKPIMIGGAASVEFGGSKADWITDALTVQLPQNFPLIRAFVWTNTGSTNAEWPIESSVSAQAAYARALASGYYAGNSFADLASVPIAALSGASPPPAARATPSAPATVSATATRPPTAIATATAPPLATPGPATPSLVSAPSVQNVTASSAVVAWATDLSAAGEVRYSADQSYNLVAQASTRLVNGTTSYVATLTGLQPATRYNYRIYTGGYNLTPAATTAFTTLTALPTVTTPTPAPPPTQVRVPASVIPVGQKGAWELIFDDDFSGPGLDPAKWSTCYPWQTGTCTNDVNHELELYNPEDVLVDSATGILRLRAQQRPMLDDNGQAFNYSSGMVSTGGIQEQAAPTFAFTYGYVEARVKVPQGQGLWTAFWLAPVSYTWPPEIDIMEILGHKPNQDNMIYHWKVPGSTADHQQSTAWTGPDFSAGYHVVGIYWTRDAITWYVDGIARFRYSQAANIYDQPMYVLLNLAVGGWPGAPDASTTFPAYFDVDYVRVWQPIQ